MCELHSKYESQYRMKFSRAKKPDTLLLMVKRQVREANLYFNEEVNTYRRSARNYAERGNVRAHALFAAADQRLHRLAEKGVKLSDVSLVG